MATFDTRRAVTGWFRSYLLTPRFSTGEAVRFSASDGISLAGWWLPGPPDAPAAIVLVHGVMHHSRHPLLLRFAERLRRGAPVLVVDLRGHGHSGGVSTLGRDEPLDVLAAVDFAAARSKLPVVVVGVSLGAAAALLAAGRRASVAGVVAVSAPAFTSWERPGAARLYNFARSRAGRGISAVLLRTRIAARFGEVSDAADAVAQIAPAWIVLVHDPHDQYFGPEHPTTIQAWSGGRAEIWWEPGSGHGTDLLDAGLADRILERVWASR